MFRTINVIFINGKFDITNISQLPTRRRIDQFLKRYYLFVLTKKILRPSLPTLVRVEDLVQHRLVVTTLIRIMTDKLHCPAVFNSGLCRTLVITE